MHLLNSLYSIMLSRSKLPALDIYCHNTCVSFLITRKNLQWNNEELKTNHFTLEWFGFDTYIHTYIFIYIYIFTPLPPFFLLCCCAAHANHWYTKVRIQFRVKQDDADSVCNQIHATHCCFIIKCYFHLHFHA